MSRSLEVLMSSVVFVGFVGAQRAGATPEQADAPPVPPPPDYWVEDELPLPGREASDPQPVSDETTAPECTWQPPILDITFPDSDLGPPPAPESFLIGRVCDDVFTGEFQWFTPGDADPVALPSPYLLAQTIWVRLEGALPAPEVVSDPAPGEAAIVSVPTFVAVSNWTGTVVDEECDPSGVLCVSVTASPSLVFVPGEPGAPSVSCAGSGTGFVEGAGSSVAQAAELGACAYAYELRTGSGGRPDGWEGAVTVTWQLAWESTSGVAGVLPEIAKSTAVVRPVHEVQAVVDR